MCVCVCVLLPDEDGREECHGGPPGAELAISTSARTWPPELAWQLQGDSFLLLLLKVPLLTWTCFWDAALRPDVWESTLKPVEKCVEPHGCKRLGGKGKVLLRWSPAHVGLTD